MSTIVDFSIVPLDKGESVSPYVARAVAVIRESGLTYRLGPMGTSIEGEFDAVMAVVKQCFSALAEDCGRIIMTIKVDYRQGADRRMETKIASVEGKLQSNLRSPSPSGPGSSAAV